MTQTTTPTNSSDRPFRCAVLTISDTRSEQTDRSGPLIREMAEEAGVRVIDSRICTDTVEEIRMSLRDWLSLYTVDVIITTGGTGIARRDVTIEAIRPMLDKEIEGFGEIFRWLSYTEDVGARAMLSRALAGTCRDKVLFALPGSTGAVKLAMSRLILPELHHFVHETVKHK